ncbi:hypothetical protein SLS54_008400 [Diplodia seriata]
MTSLPVTHDISENYDVYLGVWTNWSRGKILGSTITLRRTEVTLLIAFIAFFVSIVGTSFWRIVCYFLHRIYSTEAARDALHHQRQAVLRNSANGTSGLSNFLAIIWAWAKVDKTARNYTRICPLVALTLLILLAFAAAGGLSSRVSTAIGSDVLLSGSRCGILGYEGTNVSVVLDYLAPWLSQAAAVASLYQQQCYSNRANTEDCHTYTKKRLSATVDRNASCPFHDSICQSSRGNLRIDSGFLDSNDDFGLNTPPSERMQSRCVYHCAPLDTTNYESSYNHSDDLGHYSYGGYSLGRRPGSNYAFEHPKLSKKAWREGGIFADYDLKTCVAYYMNASYEIEDSEFYPIPELQVPHADILLFSLGTNTIIFQGTTDAWYSARSFLATPYWNGAGFNNSGVYYTDKAASIMGCTSQVQWCNPNLPPDTKCTPLESWRDFFQPHPTIIRNGREYDLLRWMVDIQNTKFRGLNDVVNILGSAALIGRQKLANGIQGPIASNQWQLEVESWFATLMAAYQQDYVEVATAQKIRSTAFTNFSTFGLGIIFGVGGLVVVLSYALEPFAAWVQRRRVRDQYSRLEWNANEVLQMQRLAHEELGVGPWRRCDGGVPVTERAGEYLALLDIDDPKHPRLKALPVTLEQLVAAEVHVVEPKGDGNPAPDSGSSGSQFEAEGVRGC